MIGKDLSTLSTLLDQLEVLRENDLEEKDGGNEYEFSE